MYNINGNDLEKYDRWEIEQAKERAQPATSTIKQGLLLKKY